MCIRYAQYLFSNIVFQSALFLNINISVRYWYKLIMFGFLKLSVQVNNCLYELQKKNEQLILCFFPDILDFYFNKRRRLTFGQNIENGSAKRKSREGYFPCDCGKSYRHSTSLFSHKKFECGKNPQFSCHICPSRFFRKCHLKCHVARIHKSVLPAYQLYTK